MGFISTKRTKHPHLLWLNSGFFLACCSLLLGFLPLAVPFRFGFWYQSEPLNAGLWVIGSLASVWLLWGFSNFKPIVAHALQTPLVWISLIVALLCLFLSGFHALPLLDWTGSPQLGEGILGFLSQGFLASVFVIVCRFPTLRRHLILFAFVAGTVLALLTIIGSNETPFPSMRGWRWAPYFFSDYIAFIALAFMIFYTAYYKSARNTYERYLLAVVIPVIFAIAYFSYNKSLWYGLTLAGASLLALRFLERCKFNSQHWLPFIGIGFIIGLPATLSFIKVLGDTVPATLVSRGSLIRYTFQHLFNNSTAQDLYALLVGRGWGTHSNFIASNLFTSETTGLFRASQSLPMEEAIARDFFHSHNSLIEFFCSLGLIGIPLYISSAYYLILSIKQEYLWVGNFFLFTILLLLGFWFQLTATIPFTLLAFALISKRYPCPLSWLQHDRFMKILYTGSAHLLVVFTVFYSTMAYKVGKEGIFLKDEAYAAKINKIISDPFIRLDSYLGSQRLVPVVRTYTYRTLKLAELETPLFTPQDVFEGNYKLAHFLFSNNPSCGSLYAYMVPLNILGELSTSSVTKDLFDRHPEAMKLWETMIVSFLHCAPRRTDMAIPYLSHLIASGNRPNVQRVINQIFEYNPDDPVGLWFSGTLKINTPGREQEGLYELKRSVENGINRFIPMQEEMLRKLQSYSG